MPPKKDAKKGGAAKELDPSLFIRKPVELEDIPIDTSVIEQLAGRIANIDTLFPVWDSTAVAEEKWGEPLNPDTIKKVKYPENLGVVEDVNVMKFFGLEPIEVAVDPKAKKEVKKEPKKGAVEAPTVLTEVLVDEHGRKLPIVFKPKDSQNPETETESAEEDNTHLEFEIARPFLRSYTEEQQARIGQQEALAAASTNPESEAPAPAKEEPKGGEIDPFLCGAYRLVQRFTPTIVKACLNLAVVKEAVAGAKKGIEEERQIIQDTFLWRAIHPQLPNGKPVVNPAGKYCVRLYLCGKWRRVYVDDAVPVTADGTPALASSSDTLELWPMLLAKAIYAVYSACGYTEVVADPMQQPDEWVRDVPSAAVGEEPQAKPEALCKPQCAAQFTSFVVHILTSWQPRAPISLQRLFTQELTRSSKLLQTLAIEGVSIIHEDDIVRDRNEICSSDRILAERNTGTRSSLLDFSLLIGDERVSASEIGVSGDQGDQGEEDNEPEGDENEELDIGGMHHIAEGSRELSTVGESGGTVIEPPDDGIVRRTKKQFKTEYLRRKAYRDSVVAKIIERERRIAKISEALLAMLTEAFFVCYFDPQTQALRTLPVLGMSYPASHKTHLMQVQLLVQWRTSPAEATPFTPNPTPEDPETEEIRGVDAGPLPLTTPLEYEWLTIQELVDRNAFLVGMDTKMLTPFDTTFTSPWVPLSSLPAHGDAAHTAAAAGAEKTKEKPKGKDAKAVVEAPVVEEFFADPGTLPVTLLRLDTSEFYTSKTAEEESFKAPQLARQVSHLSVSGKCLPLKPEIRQRLRKGALSETEAALKDEQAEVTKSFRNLPIDSDEEDEGTGFEEPVKRLVPVADYLHFTVMIHADVVLEYKDPVSHPPAANASATSISTGDEALLPPRKVKRMLPSDITLVLQEIRTDKVDPLMFVMEMKDFAYLPVVSKSFAISTKRLPANKSQPLVFWMRLFSRSSVYMQISSEVGVAVGPAEEIWAGCGKSVFLKEGHSEATRNQTQQLVFRLPLVCDRSMKTDTDTGTEETTATSMSSPSKREKAVTGMTFLHVTDRSIDRFVSLGLLPADRSKALVPLPRTQGNVVEFSTNPAEATVLLGRTFPSALFDKKAHSVPAFSWKLLVLSDDPILEPAKPINEEMVTQRYTGKFIANNKNALFRDIYTIDKLSFPLAFRLTTSHSRPVTGSLMHEAHTKSVENDAFAGMASENARKALRSALTIKGKRKEVCLVVRLYRASDMKLVGEYKGRESVICYLQTLDQFLPDGETFDVAAAVAAAAEAKASAGGKGAKAPPKPAKGAPVPTTSDTVDVLMECTLDDEIMLIGEGWQSRYPHVYDGLYPDVSLAGAVAAAEETHETRPNSPEKGKGKKDEGPAEGEDGVSKNIQVLQAQQKCLGVAPPSEILIKWQLDMLAGKVIHSSHDTRALEKEIAMKNAWEEGSAGRSEKSAAALRYYQERRAAMKKQLADASHAHTPTEEHKESAPVVVAADSVSVEVNAVHDDKYASVQHLSPVMVESLVTALGADVEVAKRRYTVLNNIPKSAGVVDILQKDPNDERLSYIKPRDTSDSVREAEILQQLLAQRAAEGSRGEARFQDIADRFVKLNTECRQEAQARVEAIAKEANADAVVLGQLWEQREKYRLMVESRNASLGYLLKRANDAKVVARAAEKKAADEAAVAAEKARKEAEKKAGKKK